MKLLKHYPLIFFIVGLLGGFGVRVWPKTLVHAGTTARERARLVHGGLVRSVAFSPDDKWVATGNQLPSGEGAVTLGKGEARVWELATDHASATASRGSKGAASNPAAQQITPSERTRTSLPKEMVLIPAGEFWMGCNEKVEKKCGGDEKPGGNVYLKAFAIDKYEVAVADYRKCVKDGTCSSDARPSFSRCNWDKPGREDHPINCVDWNQAKTYCAWAGKRLPTEAEWEKAARGTGGRNYPWGNGWDSNRANVDTGGTVSVASYASGVSPYGAYNMAGNVWEWTSSLRKPFPYKPNDGREDPNADGARVLRGGSWANTAVVARSSFRLRSDPVNWLSNLGFRCVTSQGRSRRQE